MSFRQAYYTLNTGAKIPAVGLGTWLSKPNEVAQAVEWALKAGYRHLYVLMTILPCSLSMQVSFDCQH